MKEKARVRIYETRKDEKIRGNIQIHEIKNYGTKSGSIDIFLKETKT